MLRIAHRDDFVLAQRADEKLWSCRSAKFYSPGCTVAPVAAGALLLEQQGKTRADLAPLMGGKGRVSEFFAGKRRLSIEQIRALHRELGIPADLLIT